jgi:hypothetical protein
MGRVSTKKEENYHIDRVTFLIVDEVGWSAGQFQLMSVFLYL